METGSGCSATARFQALRLARSKTSTAGVVMATYEPGGAIEPGSFAFETPTEAEVERRKRMAET